MARHHVYLDDANELVAQAFEQVAGVKPNYSAWVNERLQQELKKLMPVQQRRVFTVASELLADGDAGRREAAARRAERSAAASAVRAAKKIAAMKPPKATRKK